MTQEKNDMARFWVAVSLTIMALFMNFVLALPAGAQPGSLDTSFDSDGRVTTDFGAAVDAQGVVAQPDGKIVVAGTSGGNFALARYNRDGSLDTSFDLDGKVITDFGADDQALEVAIQPEGNIIAAGLTAAFPASDFALARYNRDGSLDTSFDSDGKVTTDFGAYEVAWAVDIQPDGEIVAGGFRFGFPAEDFALARYNRDGSLDTSFDADGKVTTDLGSTEIERALGVAIQPDGRIVAAGVTGDHDFAMVRYNRDGSLDTSFDSDGKVTTDFGFAAGARAVAIQPDGRILAAGGGRFDFVLARYHRDGSLDMGFDSDGKVTTDFGPFDMAWDVAIQPDGRIVAAGFSSDFVAVDFGLARYNRDGSLDTGFDSDGKVTTDFGAVDTAEAVAIQPDGRVVAAGVSGDDFAVARYLAR